MVFNDPRASFAGDGCCGDAFLSRVTRAIDHKRSMK
jgi:hypothetical protein